MKYEASFWDASALIPLCLPEATSSRARMLARRYAPVVWWGTSVEVHSAFARVQRSGELQSLSMVAAVNKLDRMRAKWSEILPGERLRDLAKDLVAAHPLRAADSFQLAAALIWCGERPSRRPFISADVRLCEAAAAVGFDLLQL